MKQTTLNKNAVTLCVTKSFFENDEKTLFYYFGASGANAPAETCQKLLFISTYECAINSVWKTSDTL